MITEQIDLLFSIDPDAKEYIVERGGIVHIGVAGPNLTKAVAKVIPIVDIGIPRGATTKYLEHRQEGITIYLSKNLTVKGPIRIFLDTLWRLKKLSIEMNLD
ncbi:hypothetical protein GJ688_03925 [Heliobacillus mobilis]|uniref:Uncharacterized protein n=1 Tax=Heliobacterium mobile TaxID=28064 RepID=A0A6I3SH12_HELMO|nr:CC/Se motif family (seleno)protein [Heliobacterium mobile]MTV48130.1 hypothetical protein [Heliobacterium mobile]